MDLKNLTDKKCVPCEGVGGRLSAAEIEEYQKMVPDWTVENFHHLTKTFKFKNFKDALDFVDKVGALAEADNHHPDIALSWGKVKITLFTHVVDGLSENDFILAAKIEDL